jgi:peptidyl-prolyl cis-trans isomerase C
MRVLRSILSALLLSGACLAAEPTDPPLMQEAGISVTSTDLDALLGEGDRPAQAIALRKQGFMEQLTRQVFLTRVLAEQAVAQGLADDPLIQARLRRQRDQLLSRLLLERLEQGPVPDFSQAAEEYYLTHKEDYVEGELVTASHILIKLKDRSGPVRSREEALELAREVHAKALAGEDFSALAEQYSEDPSVARNRGNLGTFGRGKMLKPFEEAAFSLREPGQISEPVESDFGFHIIQLHEYQPGRQKSLEEVRGEILAMLEKDYRESVRKRYLEDLRAKYQEVTVNQEALRQYVDARLSRLEEQAGDTAASADQTAR